ncbi:MAG: hypothetical protein AB7S26_13100 [Sandaracinaceae bacterium]
MSRRTAIALGLATLVVGCGPQGSYAEVEPILRGACTFDPCHGGEGAGGGELSFTRFAIYDALVDVPSCEYDFLDRVEPFEPERSWLWLKLSAPHDGGAAFLFSPDPSWVPPIERGPDGRYPASECPRVVDGEIDFGEVMPMDVSAGLSERRLRTIRLWIENGAPGPD